MQERPENFKDTGEDSEATLVAPRFDAEEARRAHPVVPLAEAREPFVKRPRARRGVRRPWPPALLAVALLVGVAVGGVVASKVLRRAQPAPEAALTSDAVAPAQTAEATAPPETSPAIPEKPLPVEAPREVADTKPEPRATRARRAEDAGRIVRDEAEDFENEDEGRRDRGRGKRRKHAEDDGEKEMRRIVKDAKKKAPRLVDVLVRP